ncbi:MAG: hypothetical protein Ct9H300mP1_24790 [Planctomycetaceae bacterium]|nr:MAG: hypothetical protein Ct9H300mP1_24790 [Planctomycetaceae bacterium]
MSLAFFGWYCLGLRLGDHHGLGSRWGSHVREGFPGQQPFRALAGFAGPSRRADVPGPGILAPSPVYQELVPAARLPGPIYLITSSLLSGVQNTTSSAPSRLGDGATIPIAAVLAVRHPILTIPSFRTVTVVAGTLRRGTHPGVLVVRGRGEPGRGRAAI